MWRMNIQQEGRLKHHFKKNKGGKIPMNRLNIDGVFVVSSKASDGKTERPFRLDIGHGSQNK